MAYTHKTITRWNTTVEEQILADSQGLVNERQEWIAAAIEAGKTDTHPGTPLFEENEPSASERVWNSESSAQEWKTFVTQLAQKYNMQVTVEISPI